MTHVFSCLSPARLLYVKARDHVVYIRGLYSVDVAVHMYTITSREAYNNGICVSLSSGMNGIAFERSLRLDVWSTFSLKTLVNCATALYTYNK